MLWVGVYIVLGLADGTAAAAGGSLPVDPRLDPVRPMLEQTLARTVAAGLPGELLASKVKEGLAKGVAPARIEATVVRLAESLQAAQLFLRSARRGVPATPLVRAVAEARMAGVPMAAVDPLVRGEVSEGPARRAVEILTDLSLRGYPVDRAVPVVRAVLARDAGALDGLPRSLETLRQDHGLSQAQAADALARGLMGAGTLQAALSRTTADQGGPSSARGADKAGGRGRSTRDDGLSGTLKLPPQVGLKKR